jgi:hypothetical protein
MQSTRLTDAEVSGWKNTLSNTSENRIENHVQQQKANADVKMAPQLTMLIYWQVRLGLQHVET